MTLFCPFLHWRGWLAALLFGLLPMETGESQAFAGETAVTTLAIGFLAMKTAAAPALSNLEKEPGDLGLQGARLAIGDNSTTGKFLNQAFHLEAIILPPDGDASAALRKLVATGIRHIVTRLPADKLLKLADLPEARDVLLYNAGAPDDALRNEACRINLLHILPSRAMLADALGQYLVRKRWSRWFLVVGLGETDREFANAVRRTAGRFGGRIVEEKDWTYTHDARRTAMAEIPLFTQNVNYDVLILADERGDFGEYFAYRTWEARPVAGTQGLRPTAWHWTHEQWGAAQLQRRFQKSAGRRMYAEDYAAWLAIRAVGEAATRTGTTDFTPLRNYILGPDFSLQGFKGQKLTFRHWNRQLRQPVLLAAPKALVASAPQEGFLHPKTALDTLGYDKPESGCTVSHPGKGK